MVKSSVQAKEMLEELLKDSINDSTNDWNELCKNCRTLIRNAKMTDEDIDKIVSKIKRENG